MALYCSECKRTLNDDNFYTKRNGEKLAKCKHCATMFVDNWDPSTFLPILEEIDVPYIEDEWNEILRKITDASSITGMTVLGKYLSKMKLKQWKIYSWADSDRLNEERKAKKILAMKQQGYAEEQIKQETAGGLLAPPPSLSGQKNAPMEIPQQMADLVSDSDLTEDDKKYLMLKWGLNYTVTQYVKMEEQYQNMAEAYDISTPSHEDYLIKICKVSLKMDNALDIGDFDGFNKLARIYDMLNKSAKFTASQNKSESSEFVDSIGEFAMLCEKFNGEIERYEVTEDLDVVDKTMRDYQLYVERLVKNETNLSELLDNAIKIYQQQQDEDEDDDDLFFGTEDIELSDEDFKELYNFVDTERDKDGAQ